MRLLVTGGRDFDNGPAVFEVIEALHPAVVIHGSATGADLTAQGAAALLRIPVLAFPANWATHGKAAGPIRNAKMLKEGKPDLVVAFPGGKGTANMIKLAKDAGVPVLRWEP